jgi:recombination protein RecR
MRIPKAVQNLIEAFERLPGIGPKSAARLTYYLLHAPKEISQQLAQAAYELKKKTVLCNLCKNIAESDPCDVCQDTRRDHTIICVVEEPLDVWAIEKAGVYHGIYHVLHGRIAPLENMGPEDIFIKELLPRLKNPSTSLSATGSGPSGSGQVAVKEIILATNPDMEGEATALYIQKLLQPQKIKITRIAQGIPTGGDLEYADETTLKKALEGRNEY